jgi:hypothetical protein
MGAARRRKRSGNYPSKTENSRLAHDGWTCPGCNLQAILCHMIHHDREINTLMGNQVIFALSEKPGSDLCCDFGLITVRQSIEDESRTVTAMGKTVMRLTPNKVELLEPGAWVDTLLGIRWLLDARFGPITEPMPQHAVE